MGWTLPSSPTPTLPKSQGPCDEVSEQLLWPFTHPAAPGKVPAVWLSPPFASGSAGSSPIGAAGLPASSWGYARETPARQDIAPRGQQATVELKSWGHVAAELASSVCTSIQLSSHPSLLPCCSEGSQPTPCAATGREDQGGLLPPFRQTNAA